LVELVALVALKGLERGELEAQEEREALAEAAAVVRLAAVAQEVITAVDMQEAAAAGWGRQER
jgi:hypothetical protein